MKVDVHRHERQRRVGQRELRIVLDGLREMADRGLQRLQPIGHAVAETGHECAIGLGVSAVSIARFRRGRGDPAFQ